MSWVIWVIIAMYAASAVLPILGLWGLYRTALSDAHTYRAAPVSADGEGPTFGQFNVLVKFLHEATLGRPQAAMRDFIFIGLGVLLGAAASVWSVIPA